MGGFETNICLSQHRTHEIQGRARQAVPLQPVVPTRPGKALFLSDRFEIDPYWENL
jgi:hypothetical protein